MEDSFSGYHPIINFGYFVVVLVIGMFVTHPAFMGIALFSAFVYSGVLKGWGKAFKSALIYVPIIIIVILINPMFNHYGVTILFYLNNGNPVTLESIVYGIVMGVMLITIFIWFSCYNKVMTSDKFIYLFGRIIPALSLILSMVLRFVPKFIAQIKVISNGQKCIGRDLSNGNIFQRAKHGITILSIMITWALENAIETADSMKARGYGLKGRTAFSIYRFDKRDAVVGSVMLGLLALIIVGMASGNTFVQYNPKIKIAGLQPLTISSLLTYIVYFVFCMLPVILDGVAEFNWYLLKKQIPERNQ
ncbi:energy-coupling factor transporter transmembrane component T [Eubacterium callanderi]|uniref:energy-coupling factor transporter transmembrane component T n=1 Tax=Eubacterium callanderi TaxID=53442 RepID=UPI001D14723A|nr:energy-coupling factor transporter transmembrane component T [Eubacterium callanderi]MCC3402630.1 energy-coupling factor transporter transmembrane protein EcfT [Eubacterium callanderi]